ncbi:MAG: hypothetical protein NZM09_07120, partial [Ignavibacterium sp.]|nr:hypothetical protein [Ignavibacterium sp.]MDW8375452.1 hypothetical protein [Ignavibacteriales bacterium]
MRKILLSIALLLLISENMISQINNSLIVRTPVPYRFSRLVEDPSIIQLFVVNTSGQEVRNFKVSFNLFGPDGSSVAGTKDFHPRMNKFTLAPGQSRYITGPEVLDPDAIEYDQSIYSSVLSSNMLPEGSYLLCVSLIDSAGIQIGNPPQICQTITIYHPQPPELVSPFNEENLLNNLPQFTWSPVVGADPSVIIDYRLKIVKVFPGQTPRTAIDNNIPILDKIVTNTTYQYLPSDVVLSGYPDIVGYAWQVQAIDRLTQQPAATREGKSEVFMFYPPEEQPSSITLISPSDNSDFSPSDGTFTFAWYQQINTQYEFLGLKIVEVGFGQTPSNAISGNNPVFFKTDIIKTATSYTINQNENVFEDGKKYAWQVYALNPGQNAPVVSSEIWTFTVDLQAGNKIKLLMPQNNAVLKLDSIQNVYYFTWDPSQITQPTSNLSIKIVPLENGQDPSVAIDNNDPVYNKNNLPPLTSNITISKDEGVFGNGLYAWQVKAINNNQVVAESNIWVFSVNTPPENLENLKEFFAHNYKIRVLSITNPMSNNFSGQGEVILWNDGPRFGLDLNALQLINVGSEAQPLWKLVRGQILQQVPLTTVNLDYRDPGIPQQIPPNSKYANSKATMDINSLKFTPNSNSVNGIIKLKTPFLDRATNDNITLQSSESSFRVHPQTKIDSGSVKLSAGINSTLLDPQDFGYELNQESEFEVTKNKLVLKLSGKAKLPPNVKDKAGNQIIASFNNVGGFKFEFSFKPNSINYSVNPDIWIQFDLIDVDIYHGRFFLKEGVVAFDQVKSGGLNSINLDVNDSTYLAHLGFNCKINEDNATSKTGKFRGYKFKVSEFSLIVVNNKISNLSNLSGDIEIPFINQNAKFDLEIT